MSEKTKAEQFDHYKKIWRYYDHDDLVSHPEPEMEGVFFNGTGRNMYVERLFLEAAKKIGKCPTSLKEKP